MRRKQSRGEPSNAEAIVESLPATDDPSNDDGCQLGAPAASESSSTGPLPAEDPAPEAPADASAQPPDATPAKLAVSPEHRRQLEESGIDEKVALERGYKSVTVKAELRGYGFSDAQCRVPALLVPIYGVGGEIVTYQARPNTPRVVNGKALKYETPKGSNLAIDVPRRVRDSLHDPNVPLWITEGSKKADSGASRDLCIVALLGVWGWRGRNAAGGLTALADWERIALKGRKVYLAFDSDVIEKKEVHGALMRLRAFLEQRGASVKIVRLPPGPSGSKVGLDDFLVSGKSVQDLLDLVTDDLPRPTNAGPAPGPYFVRDGATFLRKETQHGEVEIQLANFTAQIVTDIRLDDGQETQREFEIEASLSGEAAQTFTVPARSFASMNWPLEHLGASASVSAGFGAKDHMRAAVQVISGKSERRTIYTHSGWREVPGTGICYLHAAGSVGPNGTVLETRTRLSGAAAGMVLPDPVAGQELTLLVERALRFLDLGPRHLTCPLLAAAFRAALGNTDFSIFLHGTTGTFKTEVATIIQSYFGTGFDARTLPGSFSSTANALEMQAFQFKDAVFVIDDWVPEGSGPDVQRAHALASRLLRAQGNLQGRGRLASDASPRSTKAPRGLMLMSAEDVPARLSAVARALLLEVNKGDFSAAVLTECQQHIADGVHAAVMASFLRWVAGRHAQVKHALHRRAIELRSKLMGRTSHGRTASIAGDLQAGFEAFLAFAQESGALHAERVAVLRREAWDAIQRATEDQAQHHAAAEPAGVFLRLLRSAISSGGAHIGGRDGGTPANATDLGWKTIQSSEAGIVGAGPLRPSGACVGWADGADLYLDPDASYREAQRMATEGEKLSLTVRALGKRLHEKGYLLSTDDARERNTVRRTIGGRRAAVLHLSLGVLLGTSQPSRSAQDPTGDGVGPDVGPVPWDGFGTRPDGTGPRDRPTTGPRRPQDPALEPNGPVGPDGTVPRGDPQPESGFSAVSDAVARDDLAAPAAAEQRVAGPASAAANMVDDDEEVL
jgi:hypothetical protein